MEEEVWGPTHALQPSDDEAEGRVLELIEELEYSVVLAAHKADWQDAASVVLPVALWSEEEGTYTNFEGRVQFAGKAIEPGGDALPVWEAKHGFDPVKLTASDDLPTETSSFVGELAPFRQAFDVTNFEVHGDVQHAHAVIEVASLPCGAERSASATRDALDRPLAPDLRHLSLFVSDG